MTAPDRNLQMRYLFARVTSHTLALHQRVRVQGGWRRKEPRQMKFITQTACACVDAKFQTANGKGEEAGGSLMFAKVKGESTLLTAQKMFNQDICPCIAKRCAFLAINKEKYAKTKCLHI